MVKLLVLSNGHGEDVIATRIIEQLQRCPDPPQLFALPIVGTGYLYEKRGIPMIAPVQQMPSGGFIYKDGRQLWRDIKGGLIQLTLAQYRAIRQWGQQGGKILAVGDIVPLALAWLSGADFAFVGTAKSEYYIQDETKWLNRAVSLEIRFGCIYLPWERWLMRRSRCTAIFPRDSLTAKVLQRYHIPAFDLGNPMMDGLTLKPRNEKKISKTDLTIVLLPGSRSPEAYHNWALILEGVKGILAQFTDEPLSFLAAIAPSLPLTPFETILKQQGWQAKTAINSPIADVAALVYTCAQGELILCQNAYEDCLVNADFGIAMAGTATEQLVGLGKPVITIAGKGPQFVYSFAEAQTRLLGKSVILVEKPEQIAIEIDKLRHDPQRLQEIAHSGRERMGEPGAAQRIAQCLIEVMK